VLDGSAKKRQKLFSSFEELRVDGSTIFTWLPMHSWLVKVPKLGKNYGCLHWSLQL